MQFRGFDVSNRPLVSGVPGLPEAALPARSTIELTQEQIGSSVVVLFDEGDLHRPIIVGVLREQQPAVDPLPASRPTVSVKIDDDRLVLSADREIELSCGAAKITLTKAGKIIIHGRRVQPIDRCQSHQRRIGSDQLSADSTPMAVPGMTTANPYDDMPYKCLPIEWTAPERLSLTSLLHGGPRLPRDDYRVLELGCGNGANMLPQAYYRDQATFVGVDGAASQIEIARARKSELGVSNAEFIHADFASADECLSGQFDYIVGHGIFSWVPDDVRDALLRLCARRLRRGGLLYLNYNANPGWNVRGMVRDFLMAQTAGIAAGLRARAEAAQEVAARVAASLPNGDQAYSRLLGERIHLRVRERRVLISRTSTSTEHNRAYWRSEFIALARHHGLEFVADADFNYATSRIPDDLVTRLCEQQINGRGVDDTVDLLCYRQLHSPILTLAPFVRRPPDLDDFANLTIARLSHGQWLERSRAPDVSAPVWIRGRGERRPALDRLRTPEDRLAQGSAGRRALS